MKILEPNMYVRTKKGMIAKIVSKENVSGSLHREEIVFILDNGNRLALHSQKVVKVSHSIIDLIEVGDIVTTKHLGIEKEYIEVINNETSLEILKSYFKEKSLELISVVTKQAFESMQYEVK